MKRLLPILLSALLILSGCAAEATQLNPNKPITITLWHYYHGVQQTAIDGMVKEYNETVGLANGVVIDAGSYGGVSELSESVFASARGEAGSLPMPDIFSSYSDSAYELAKMDVLADIGRYFTQEELSAYVSAYLDEGYFADGMLRVFPVAKGSETFMLNKTDWDVFEAAVNSGGEYDKVNTDMLKSFEGIQQAAEIYYKWTDDQTPEPNDGMALFGIDSAANYVYVGARQLGSELINPKTESLNLDTEVLHKLWNSFYVPMLKGYYGALGRFRSDDVKTGDLLCFVGATTSAAYFPTHITTYSGQSHDIEAIVMEYPVFEGGAPVAIQQGAGMCIAKSDSVREKAAADFLKWFTDPVRNTDFALDAAGYFPVTNEAIGMISQSDALEDLRSGDSEVDANLALVMESGLKQLGSYTPYSPPVFSGTAKLRSFFEGLKTSAAADRAALLQRVAEGADYNKELAAAISTDSFNRWIAELEGVIK